MSAYITKLEIPGFSGGIQLWKNYVNSFESGGGGGGGGESAISEDKFTLSVEYPLENNIEDFGFVIGSRIRLNHSFQMYGPSRKDVFQVKMTTTPAYSAVKPSFLIFSFEGALVWSGDLTSTNPYTFEVSVYDDIGNNIGNYSFVYADSIDGEHGPVFLDTIPVQITYYNESSGIGSIVISDYMQTPS